ncbi:hypothetical protein ACFL2G_04070 [Candidatus Omnitrophota bacterium]
MKKIIFLMLISHFIITTGIHASPATLRVPLITEEKEKLTYTKTVLVTEIKNCMDDIRKKALEVRETGFFTNEYYKEIIRNTSTQMENIIEILSKIEQHLDSSISNVGMIKQIKHSLLSLKQNLYFLNQNIQNKRQSNTMQPGRLSAHIKQEWHDFQSKLNGDRNILLDSIYGHVLQIMEYIAKLDEISELSELINNASLTEL